MSAEIRRLNLLRAQRGHLEAQVESGRGGREDLRRVDVEIAELEPVVRAMPGTDYLFRVRRR